MFDQIESLKRQYTDKFVVVAAGIPELARFEGHVGQVKTVNMSGRALVEFDCWANIGWYDIELDYLKVVPRPEPKAEPAKHEKHEAPAKAVAKAPPAAGEKKLSPLEMARMQGAAKGGAAPVAAKPAPSAGQAASPGAAKGKMSTVDVLAAARAKKAAESAAEPEAQASAPAPPAAREPEKAQTASAAPAKPAAAKPALATGERPSVSDILAWCRANDAK